MQNVWVIFYMEQKINSGLSCFVMLVHMLNVKVSKEQLEHIMALEDGGMDEVQMLESCEESKTERESSNAFI